MKIKVEQELENNWKIMKNGWIFYQPNGSGKSGKNSNGRKE